MCRWAFLREGFYTKVAGVACSENVILSSSLACLSVLSCLRLFARDKVGQALQPQDKHEPATYHPDTERQPAQHHRVHQGANACHPVGADQKHQRNAKLGGHRAVTYGGPGQARSDMHRPHPLAGHIAQAILLLAERSQASASRPGQNGGADADHPQLAPA